MTNFSSFSHIYDILNLGTVNFGQQEKVLQVIEISKYISDVFIFLKDPCFYKYFRSYFSIFFYCSNI